MGPSSRSGDADGGRLLDFIVIGTQKGGTTSLWEYLRGHPAIFLPGSKEAPFFYTPEATQPAALHAFMRTHFADAPGDAVLGKATPQYMMGLRGASVAEIAEWISRAVPSVRLIALLRDPIERAVSHYRMSVRRGLDRRSFDEAVDDLLEPDQLAAARKRPTEENTYVVQGEYGRVLNTYRLRFPGDQVHVEFTRHLSDDPAGVLDRVLDFLGLPVGYRPDGLGARHHRGGMRKRLDQQGQASLFEFLRENVLPRIEGDAEQVARAFGFFYATWNVIPDDRRPAVSAATRARLEAHFEKDAEALAALGVSAPWLIEWRDGIGGAQAAS